METNTPFANRLAKNYKKLRKWLNKERIEAFRAYDKDIPEYPYIVDIYLNHAVIFEKGLHQSKVDESVRMKHLNEVYAAITQVFSIPDNHIVLKKRQVQKGQEQYEKLGESKSRIVVKEGECEYYINLYDYLDTGLFLDHRPLRDKILRNSNNKKVLNLFAYTGSISVAAAVGGAHVTTVDMSKTYINWAKDNFRLNDLYIDSHIFVRENVFDFLREDKNSYDTIILDPPSFSNSKKMDGSFDVQRDHSGLIYLCLERLKPNGILYFSNNNRKFQMDEEILGQFKVKDITAQSIPQDFRDQKIHKCFEITN
jgi:23S rRNA (cytosine1962-C5)-methyltransferase